MIANYHTHTFRCNHATGTEREYIEHAILGGLEVLGFADHAPMPFEGEYYSGFRMKLQETEDYVCTLRSLQKEYAKDIRILIGFEAEYYPAVFPRFLEFIEPYDIDYLLLGQHALYNEEGAPMCGAPTEDPRLLSQYIAQVKEGLSTGKFLYHAHPDMMRFVGDPQEYQKQMTDYCRFCKERNIPLEINLLGLMDNRWYPNKNFWEIAGAVGNCGIIGCDAHRADVLSNMQLHSQGEQWAKNFAIPLLSNLL
ncbi:MAG: histidinol-phosphatase [Clostridia bacterium]|nr:histidinol-phosphatase [Clostridia bacterium]